MALGDLVRSAYHAWNARDLDRLLELTDPGIEIAPLVIGVTSAGPWEGHDGVRKLVADAEERWARFEISCERVLEFGERVVALVHVEVAAGPGGPTVSGDVAHVIEFKDGLAKRFTAYRDRAEAIAAADISQHSH